MRIEHKRNYVLDAMRFLFSIMILIHHSYLITDGKFRYAPSGYIGVEFFFIVTGYYMMVHIERRWREQQTEAMDLGGETRTFVLKKLTKIWPYLLISDVVSIVVCFIVLKEGILHGIVYAYSELLMLQMAGFWGNYPTGAAWYLSALILALLFLFPIAMKFRSMFLNIIAPLMAVLILGHLTLTYGSVGNDPGLWDGYFGKGLVRAVAEIALGAVCFGVSSYISRWKSSIVSKVFFGIAEVFCYAGVAYIAYKYQPGKTDILAIMLLFAGIAITTSRQSIWYEYFNFKIFGVLGTLSMAVFLNNFYWSKCMRTIFPRASISQLMVYYVVISLLTALVVYGVVAVLRFGIHRVRAAVTEERVKE